MVQLAGNALLGIFDPDKAGVLALAAQEAGFAPTLAFTHSQLLTCLRVNRFDLVVLDPAFVEGDSRELLDAVRARGDAPVLVLGPNPPPQRQQSAQGARGRQDRQSPAEAIRAAVALLPGLVARSGDGGTMTWGPLTLTLSSRQAWWDSLPLELTPVQFRILTVLVGAAGAVVTNRELATRLWGGEGRLDRERVFAHIRRIRRKIEKDPANPRFLLTVRGEGFRLAIPPTPPAPPATPS